MVTPASSIDTNLPNLVRPRRLGPSGPRAAVLARLPSPRTPPRSGGPTTPGQSPPPQSVRALLGSAQGLRPRRLRRPSGRRSRSVRLWGVRARVPNSRSVRPRGLSCGRGRTPSALFRGQPCYRHPPPSPTPAPPPTPPPSPPSSPRLRVRLIFSEGMAAEGVGDADAAAGCPYVPSARPFSLPFSPSSPPFSPPSWGPRRAIHGAARTRTRTRVKTTKFLRSRNPTANTPRTT